MRLFRLLSGFIALVCGCAAELPTAEQVLERYVAVTGGQAAYDRVKTEVRKLSLSRSGTVLARSVEYVTRGGKYRQITNGDEETGLNDGIAWSKSKGNAEIHEGGPIRRMALRSAVILPESQWRTYYTWRKMIGLAEAEGRQCYQVLVQLAAGGEQTLYFDKETGLLVRQSEDGTSGSGPIELVLGNYQETDGIRMARYGEMHVGEAVIEVRLDDVQFNTELADSVFAMPPEIARLAKKRFSAQD